MNVFITGVSSGIGWGLAHFYLEQGHQVYGLSRRGVAEWEAKEAFKHFSFDLNSSDTDWQKAKQEWSVFFPKRLDLVVLNAGILGSVQDMQEANLAEMQQVMNVNVWANQRLLQALQQNTSLEQVVAISSGAAVNGSRGWSGYSLSKAALNMLIKLWAAEDSTVHYSALAPGLVNTAMQDYLCGREDLDVERFVSLQKLRNARYTDAMPEVQDAGKMLADYIERCAAYPSGSFLDVRNSFG
jgi:NAD(P)-dependent dehydrogenase (short-subunit alcohol dehydrogenase family)